MTSEVEILTKHSDCLKQAKEACLWLAQNADPERAAPRGHHYRQLREALNRLEGTCRQLQFYRQDGRWTKLGIHYAKAMRVAQKLFAEMNWAGFLAFAQVFDAGMRHMDELAHKRTERRGIIIPERLDFLQLPDVKPIAPRSAVN